MKMRKILPLLACSSLLLLASCGGSSSNSSSDATAENTLNPDAPQSEEADDAGDHIEGTYKAVFATLNPNINGVLPGSLTFYREKDSDRMMAFLRLFAGAPGVVHPQNVYVGGACPTMANDTNGDGVLDINEALAVVGKILIPLDSNLNSQAAGRNTFPVGDPSGSYYWERVVNFNSFYKDITNTHSTYNSEEYVKVPQGERLNLEGRVVMIQGAAGTVTLPETVGTVGRKTPQQTLPIACGIIRKQENPSGTIEESETMIVEPSRSRRNSDRNATRDEAPQIPPP